jgi:ABC-type branched-subunit amino acid transport system substrate-binding protein
MTKSRSARPSRRGVLAGAAAASAILAAPALVRAQANALKIAVLLPRSGYLAPSGQSCHRGALIAPQVLAQYGHRVELVHIDTESSVDVARTQAERAINEGAKCIVGAFDSGGTLAMAQVCEQRQVPLVVNIAGAPQLTEQGLKYLVRNFPTGGQLVVNGLKLIKDVLSATKLAPKSAVFIHANDTFGTAQRAAVDRLFPSAGMPFELTDKIAYDPTAQDLSVEVTKIRARSPDLVLVVTRAADAIKLVRDMVRQRFEPQAIISPGSPGLYDEEFYQALGPLADYHVSALGRSQGADVAGPGGGVQGGASRLPLRGRLLQRRFHRRGAPGRRRRLQACRHHRWRAVDAGDPRNRHRRPCDDRPAHPVRREGTEPGHPVGLRAEPQPHPGGGAAGRGRHPGAGPAGAAMAGAQLTGAPTRNSCPPSSSMSWLRAC